MQKGRYDSVQHGFRNKKIVVAFENSHIRSVCLPDSVRVIFHSAFQDCSDLTQVLFGPNSGLEHISGGFENCTSLESIDLSTTKLKQIDSGAFSGCTSLKEVKFPDTLLRQHRATAEIEFCVTER
mgnify:CR=1 FL=1